MRSVSKTFGARGITTPQRKRRCSAASRQKSPKRYWREVGWFMGALGPLGGFYQKRIRNWSRQEFRGVVIHATHGKGFENDSTERGDEVAALVGGASCCARNSGGSAGV